MELTEEKSNKSNENGGENIEINEDDFEEFTILPSNKLPSNRKLPSFVGR